MNMGRPDNPDSPAKRAVNYEEWFLREVDKGMATADLGKLVDHSNVRKLIDERYPV
jgi:predicted transcriptional regulator